MNQTYACLEIGSHSMKISIIGFKDEQQHALATVRSKSKGIEQGRVVNKKLAQSVLEELLLELENKYNYKIDSVSLVIPSVNIVSENQSVTIEFADAAECVEGKHIRMLEDELYKKLESKHENLSIVSIIPKLFRIENEYDSFYPIGTSVSSLQMSAEVCFCDEVILFEYLELLQAIKLEFNYVIPSMICDSYSALSQADVSNGVALLNIGADNTEFTVFRSRTVKDCFRILFGGNTITKKIAETFDIEIDEAENLKLYCLANLDIFEYNKSVEDEKIGFVEGYIAKTLEIVLNELDNFIRVLEEYLKENMSVTSNFRKIVVTGGSSEINGIENYLNKRINKSVEVYKQKVLGLRHGQYSSVLGIAECVSFLNSIFDEEVSKIKQSSVPQTSESEKFNQTDELIINKKSVKTKNDKQKDEKKGSLVEKIVNLFLDEK